MAARKVGAKVEEFGFGFPPRMIGKKIGETIYSINWLPIGGFVRVFGEQEADAEGSSSHRALFNKSKPQRALVMVAGVVMNLLLGIAAFSLFYSVNGIPQEVDYISIQAIAPNSPAQTAGLQAGDKVLSIDNQPVTEVSDFVTYMKDKGGQQVAITVTRDSSQQTYTLTPRQNPPEGEGALGVLVSNIDQVYYSPWEMPFRGTWVGIQEAYGWTRLMVESLGQMVTQAFQGVRPEVAGPVGIYQITSTVAAEGIWPLIKFIGILSINLGVINILPFPALDGGRLVFIGIESVTGKRVKPKIEAYVNMVGMILLLSLMALITVGDILRIVRGG